MPALHQPQPRAAQGAVSPSLIAQHAPETAQAAPAQDLVGEIPHPLTDDEREAAIARAGRAIEKHMATGNRADAQRALRSMEQLIARRSTAQVMRMRIARGLI